VPGTGQPGGGLLPSPALPSPPSVGGGTKPTLPAPSLTVPSLPGATTGEPVPSTPPLDVEICLGPLTLGDC
jgi:hypothetical protein